MDRSHFDEFITWWQTAWYEFYIPGSLSPELAVSHRLKLVHRLNDRRHGLAESARTNRSSAA